jgi:hypothetical protein
MKTIPKDLPTVSATIIADFLIKIFADLPLRG